MTKLLIVDDEEDMRDLLSMYMGNAGFLTEEASNGDDALKMLESNSYDLVLLDIMMPGKDGFIVCEEIRKNHPIPIIFLTAKGEEWDKVKGLQLGGDDYIVKPFSPGEVVARIHAVLRRYHLDSEKLDYVEKGTIKVYLSSRTAKVQNQIIPLTLKEFELLSILMKNDHRVLSREQLLVQIWGDDYTGGTRTVDTHVKTLRMKLGKEAATYIQTVWGVGYKFEVPPL
ncbi:DNA-binding response OmpR family regulator [Oikeobacillus pervagus]|uniref:DNA-binding response OmpR family regulator n=1 Tax=Oikeobacillus pervagus TaxID=1325931 RepID=A0AAJ1WK57_9BACI|nr:response regulator transcription factor [Oikeobacillus pervagus]MDQ0214771.1 DNA-binding response OmpR family regulator [Oikeobacillus pervagus]